MKTKYTAELIKVTQMEITEDGCQKFFDTVEVRDKESGVVVDRVLVEASEDTEPYNQAVDSVVGEFGFEWIE